MFIKTGQRKQQVVGQYRLNRFHLATYAGQSSFFKVKVQDFYFNLGAWFQSRLVLCIRDRQETPNLRAHTDERHFVEARYHCSCRQLSSRRRWQPSMQSSTGHRPTMTTTAMDLRDMPQLQTSPSVNGSR